MATLKDLLDSGMSRDEINALLSQGTVGTEGFQAQGFMGGEPYMPPPQQPQVDQAPMNMIRNNTTGREFAPETMSGQPSQSQPAGPAMDYSSPIEIGGYGKGYRLKGDSTRAVLADGRIVSMGRDTGTERRREKEDLGLMKDRVEIDRIRAQTEKDNRVANAALLNPEGIRLKQGERFKRDGSGQVEAIPGSDLERKQTAKITDAASQVDTHNKGADALIKNINILIGDDSAGAQQHPGLRGSVGYIDNAIPGFTQAQNTAKSFIKSLKDKSAVSGLQSIRQAGTAPGSITEKEWPIFQNLINNLDAGQDIDSYKAQLRELRDEAIASKSRTAMRFNESTGREYSPQEPKNPKEQNASAGGKVMSMQDVMDTAKSRGKTTDQVMKDARAAGFTIK